MIVVDVQALQSPAYARRGVGRHVADLVRTLEREHGGVVAAYTWNPRLALGDELATLDGELGLGDRLVPASSLRGRDVDVLHIPAPFAPLQWAADEAITYADWAVPVRARRLVLTVHDLIPWRLPDVYLADPGGRARYHQRLAMLPTASAVIVVSEAVGRDVVELAGVADHRVIVGGAGTADRFTRPTRPRPEILADLGGVLPPGTDDFVLVVGAPDWRKNLDGAMHAYALLPGDVRERTPLVVAAPLPADAIAATERLAVELGIADRIVLPGFVDDSILVALYQSASVVVVPSRIEGFGLPVLEARRCGARTICSDTSSLIEVLPEPAARFDPDDPPQIADRILAALTDPGYQAVLDAAPDPAFTWSQAADCAVAAYRGHGRPSSIRRVQRASRITIGIVSHLPPNPSGIADHSERLIAALAEQPGVRVEAFDPDVAHRLGRAPSVPVRHLGALHERWASRALDHVLYCVGNGPIHRPLADAMRTVPGAILLHDVRVPLLLGRDTSPDGSAEPLVRNATITLVQSAHAVDLLRRTTGVHAIDVGPHPCWHDGDVTPLDDTGPPWVISAGIAHEAKQTDRFVAAMRRLVADGSARAAVVGDGGERFVVGHEGIVATGHVDGPAFDAWLRRAALAVQLRAGTNGESSGVVAHALARGVPVVVTSIGAMAELPDDVAVQVPVDVEAGALADVIGALLADVERRSAMRGAALAFAARETPAAQARRVVEALTTTRVAG